MKKRYASARFASAGCAARTLTLKDVALRVSSTLRCELRVRARARSSEGTKKIFALLRVLLSFVLKALDFDLDFDLDLDLDFILACSCLVGAGG